MGFIDEFLRSKIGGFDGSVSATNIAVDRSFLLIDKGQEPEVKSSWDIDEKLHQILQNLGTLESDFHLTKAVLYPEIHGKEVTEQSDAHQVFAQMSPASFEIPVFTGVNLRPWLDWVEQYFVFEMYTELEKLNFAHGFIEGEAWTWYQHHRSMFPFETWDQLRTNLLLRFGDENDPERLRIVMENQRWLQKMNNKYIEDQKKETNMEEKEKSYLVAATMMEPVYSIQEVEPTYMTQELASTQEFVAEKIQETEEFQELESNGSQEANGSEASITTVNQVPLIYLERSLRCHNAVLGISEEFSSANMRNNLVDSQSEHRNNIAKPEAHQVFDLLIIQKQNSNITHGKKRASENKR